MYVSMIHGLKHRKIVRYSGQCLSHLNVSDLAALRGGEIKVGNLVVEVFLFL